MLRDAARQESPFHGRGSQITPSYKDVIAFVVLLVMLAVRPAGLLGASA